MKIVKILNNNAVIVMDGDKEKIAIGSGVGFNTQKNADLNPDKIEKLFVLKENKKLQELLQQIPEQYFLLAEAIIAHAEKKLHTKLDDHLLLTLTDHLYFAIERTKQGIYLKNKLLQEIKILYRKEFEIGLWGIQHIEEKMNIKMPVDEAAFIALHIHTVKLKGGDIQQTVKQTAIVQEMVEIIEDFLGMTIKEEDLSFERLIIHLRFALIRTTQRQTHKMDPEILQMIKQKFALSFRCAQEIANKLASRHNLCLPDDELGYITLHIERLRKYPVEP